MWHNSTNLQKMKSCDVVPLWALIFCLLFQSCYGFYLVGSNTHKYAITDELLVKVNSLTSIGTQMPFNYYSLSFCKPEGDVKGSAESPGELLMGDRIENSPYKFRMHNNESNVFLCWVDPLSGDQLKILRKRIDDMYQVTMILDNLPAIRFVKKEEYFLRWTGYPVGIKVQDVYYLYNHLKFNVIVHKSEEGTPDKPSYMVVGFEVKPCSYMHNADSAKNLKMYEKYPSPIKCDASAAAMPIKEGQPVVFTYEVTFEESDIKSPSKWDGYLTMEESGVHWFSFINALVVITVLACLVLLNVKRDLTRYEKLDINEDEGHMNEGLSGWKLVMGDVFRAPSNPALLCIMVGDGVRIVLTILFAALGFVLPSSRGTFITAMLLFYMILGVAAGYVSVWLWRTIGCGDQKGWVSIALKTACFFPGISFLILTALNFLFWESHSTGAIPFSLYVTLLMLWFLISIPLSLIGGYFGAKAPQFEYLVQTDQIPAEMPHMSYLLSWLSVLGGGVLPFCVLYIELFYIMSNIWIGGVYYAFGFLFIGFILFVVVCAEASILLTYLRLRVGDGKWWWTSFFASGSVALYIFWYSIRYLVFDLNGLSGPMSATIYLGYSVLMVIAVMLSTGAVGFLSSFWFVFYLFSSVKSN